MLRHVGTIQNTGSRVIVAFMQLPEAPQKCLVIQTDSLPEYYKESINRMVQSEEGQAATDFANVLGRYKVEGQNKDMLTLLHQSGNLIALPIDNVVMTPVSSMSIPLRDVLIQLGRDVAPRTQAQADQYAQPKKFNQFEQNQQADLDSNRALMAQSKLRQAQLLEDDARKYRNEAYELQPSLRPLQQAVAPSQPAPAITQGNGELSADFTPQVNAMASIASTYGKDAPAETGETQLNLFPDSNPNA
jgi:hypothetical protein